ncbi:MAG TPA: hypothetical protein VHZ52_00285 [Acidobacteriaceae bacterium]|jgi:hypothetical protein|nr:hypothetical protein [Acidobacteriaceae bacterium]
MRLACVVLLGLASAANAQSGAAAGGSQAPESGLQFESSDARLKEAFDWAKAQALRYAHGGSSNGGVDPVGPWYEAALPGRDAFCMRDVAHQTTGAAALGLDAQNRNMLRRFAAAVAPGRDWAGYWEIDKQGHASDADYVSDADFWYNLPANFDVLDGIVRMWRWTGDESYLNDASMQRFFQATATDYVKAWQLEPDVILTRPRIMNRRLADASKGKFVESRGIPSYSEGEVDFNLGTDLLAAEYRGFVSLASIAKHNNDAGAAQRYAKTANEILELVEHRAWSEKEQHFMGFFSQDGKTHGMGDAMVLYFGATHDPAHIRAALKRIESAEYLKEIGIEEESYLAQIFYRYGETEAAYERIVDLTRADKERREYPEVSYSVIGALVTGMMGVDVVGEEIASLARLRGRTERAKVSGLHIRGRVVDVEHVGDGRSVLTNHSDTALRWRAEFAGRAAALKVDGKMVRAESSFDEAHQPLSWVMVDVPAGKTVVVSR